MSICRGCGHEIDWIRTIVGKNMTLYRTERGNWFSVSKEDYGEQAGHLETEESVKRIFEATNNIEAFERFFGEVEKA